MKQICAFLFLVIATILCAGTCLAKGTLTVQKLDKPIQIYSDVRIVVSNKTLKVTSADGKGTLVFDKAACSYVGELQMCLPNDCTLVQGGTSSPINIMKGTAYVNFTDQDQPLSNSSTRLPPNGILFSLTTKIGTIINLTGVIDEVNK